MIFIPLYIHSEMPFEVFSGGIYNWTALASINELSEKILSKNSPAWLDLEVAGIIT